MKRFQYLVLVGSKPFNFTLLIALLAMCLALIAATRPQYADSFPIPLPRLSFDAGTAMCTFSNPAYSGLCTESASLKEGESAEGACNSILQCLNNVRCEKTYCSSTTIREGWKLESAKDAPEKQ